MPDPDTWPALLAETVTLIREKLNDDGDTVDVAAILNELMERRGYDVYTAVGNVLKERGEQYALTAGEVAYMTGTALQMLAGTGEIRQLGGGSHHHTVKILFEHLGWTEFVKGGDYRIDGKIAATPIRAAMAKVPATGEIRWTQVPLLIEQSIAALRSNLPTLALVGARIAAEEAIRSALQDVGHDPKDIETLKAWRREEKLFDTYLTSPGGFAPIDREATKSALSAIRDAGNNAAHTGEAVDAQANELLIHFTTRAIASLSAAVDAHL